MDGSEPSGGLGLGSTRPKPARQKKEGGHQMKKLQ